MQQEILGRILTQTSPDSLQTLYLDVQVEKVHWSGLNGSWYSRWWNLLYINIDTNRAESFSVPGDANLKML